MSVDFRNKRIKESTSTEYFQICKILEKLNEEDTITVKNFIEKISNSNQECIRILENIYSQCTSIEKN